jgi:hypothetical protein
MDVAGTHFRDVVQKGSLPLTFRLSCNRHIVAMVAIHELPGLPHHLLISINFTG